MELFYLRNICSDLTIDLRILRAQRELNIHYFCHFEKFRVKYKIVAKCYYN